MKLIKPELEKDINFEYRFSSFQSNNFTILSARLHFEPNGNLKQLVQTTKNTLSLKEKHVAISSSKFW